MADLPVPFQRLITAARLVRLLNPSLNAARLLSAALEGVQGTVEGPGSDCRCRLRATQTGAFCVGCGMVVHLDQVQTRIHELAAERVMLSEALRVQTEEVERLQAEIRRKDEALRGIDAALNQPATFPADVALARTLTRAALSPSPEGRSERVSRCACGLPIDHRSICAPEPTPDTAKAPARCANPLHGPDSHSGIHGLCADKSPSFAGGIYVPGTQEPEASNG